MTSNWLAEGRVQPQGHQGGWRSSRWAESHPGPPRHPRGGCLAPAQPLLDTLVSHSLLECSSQHFRTGCTVFSPTHRLATGIEFTTSGFPRIKMVALSFCHVNFKKFLGVFKTRFTFMLLSVLPACVEVHGTCAVTVRTAVIGGCCKLNPGPLQEQSGLSIAESSL